MKKIKFNIGTFNRYLTFFKNSIKKKLKLFSFSIEIKSLIIKKLRSFRFPLEIKKSLFFLIRLEFMQNIKFKTSIFSRYLILIIVLLFSYIFYLSIPAFYNYGKLQKDITKKLLSEFNLNASLSANITYKILPSPNFEISNVILSTDSDKKFNEFAQIKKMKIFVSIKKLHSQNELTIKKIVFLEANFNINKNSFYYINDFFKKKSSSKKISIKKSTIFFRESANTSDTIALSSIQKSKVFYDDKENNNKIIINGSIFNVKYNLTFLRNISNINLTNFKIKFKQLNTQINNEFLNSPRESANSEGIVSIDFPGFRNKVNYEIGDKFILFSSDRASINNQKVFLNGKINTSPFYYNVYIDLDDINVIKFFKNFSKVKNLLQNKIFLHNNFNGKIVLNINSLSGIKLFNKAEINLEFLNGKLVLNNSSMTSNKVGKIIFLDSVIQEKDDKIIFHSKFLFNIINQKQFYQKLQIPKSNRREINNIYFETEKNLDDEEFKINKLIINKKLNDKEKDLSNSLKINDINNAKNWIELKKILNQIFSEIN